MYPDLPSDTWEPDPPFHWIEGEDEGDGEDKDTDGRASLPAVGSSSDGPEPDANSGGERLFLVVRGIGIALIVILFILLCFVVWRGCEWVVDWVPRRLAKGA